MPRATVVVPETLRARKQTLVRAEIRRAAWELFTRRGYETTTVEDIAAAAGVSRRTVFRYYASKEDVVVGTFDETAAEFVAAFAGRPRREPPLESIRHALLAVMTPRVSDTQSGRAILKLMRESPGLRRARLDRIARIEEQLAELVARRQGSDPARDSLPAVVGYVARAMVDAAFNVWYEQGSPGAEAMVDQLFGNLARLAAGWRPPTRSHPRPLRSKPTRSAARDGSRPAGSARPGGNKIRRAPASARRANR